MRVKAFNCCVTLVTKANVSIQSPLVYILKLLVRYLPLLLERAGVRRVKLRLFFFPPHPTFSLWRRLSPRDKVRVSEYLQANNVF